VSTDAVLDAVLKSLKRGIEDSRAIVTRDPLPMVLADELQLSQLLQNLIGNAIKFRREDTVRVHIGARRTATGWNVSVSDNGIGVAPEHSERIFVIFQRLHTKTQYPGTGIGLAICKKIAERHGGRIWLEPSPGGGATFIFSIDDGGSYASKEQNQDELRIHATSN
jgi:hypothetical protein